MVALPRWWKARLLMGASLALVACGGPPSTNGAPDGGSSNPDLVDAGAPDAGDPGVPVVDLRADVNRDGVVSLDSADEDQGEDAWSAERGAVFLANIDDDSERCTYDLGKSDVELAKCHDAADEVINGPDDLLDLARLRTAPWPDAPEGTSATVSVSAEAANFVRLFMNEGTSFGALPSGFAFNALTVRAGLELAIEAKDVVRDLEAWDGYVDVTWTVTVPEGTDAQPGTFTDVVRLRVSPVLTFHHLLPAETVYVSDTDEQDSTLFMSGLQSHLTASGISAPLHRFAATPYEWDQWIQDFFEPGYMSMPGPGGAQQVMRVNYRSANVYEPNKPASPLRPAGRIVYQLLGKDVAAVQEFNLNRTNTEWNFDTLNSFGNTETIPPYTHNGVSYPFGRLYRGSASSAYPDRKFSKMMEAQSVQPPVYVDTSWLLVAHVDETISFLPVNSPRGWVVLVNDPTLARQMLEAEVMKGNGNVQMFVGKNWIDYSSWNPKEIPADISISEVLADTDIMNESAASGIEVDAQLEIIKQETGITDAEIVRIPFLHQPVDGYSLAFQPGTVNLLALDAKNVVAPDPFGPVIDGKDIFKVQMEQALAPYGITVHWLDDWNLYHRLAGEVHCGTNAARAIPDAKWWESGR